MGYLTVGKIYRKLVSCYLVAVSLGWAVMVRSTSSGSGLREYCKWEQFSAQCEAGQVIVMRKALYGRMQANRCIERDYGYVGCSTDVLLLSDSRCSGRPNCQIKIPDEKFDAVSKCPNDLSRYYLAEYSCLDVIQRGDPGCVLKGRQGYIASVTSQQSGCGSTETPWLIKAKPEQSIRIDMIDFAISSANATLAGSPCFVYVILKEGGTGKSITVCGGKSRDMKIYESTTNSVEIRVVTGAKSRARYFLLKYSVTGCLNMESPPGGWIRREGNSLRAGCDYPSAEWVLHCNGTAWNGRIGNCTKVTGPGSVLGKLPIPYVLMMVAIALLIGVCVLCVGLLILRRQRRNERRRHHPTNPEAQTPMVLKEEPYKKASFGYGPPPYITQSDSPGENEYAYVEDFLPSPPSSSQRSHSPAKTLRHPRHTGMPPSGVPVKLQSSQQDADLPCAACGDPPHYFELDHDDPRNTIATRTASPAATMHRFQTQSQPNLVHPVTEGGATIPPGTSGADRTQKESV